MTVAPEGASAPSVKISFRWLPDMSKNAMLKRGKGGRVYRPEAVTKLMDDLAWAVKEQTRKGKVTWVEAPVYLGIHVVRANFRSDPINVLDVLADAVKTGIGVDDRWFVIRHLTWEMGRPAMVYMTIEQNTDVAHQVCGTCLAILPATAAYFHQNRSRKSGLAAECRGCVNA